MRYRTQHFVLRNSQARLLRSNDELKYSHQNPRSWCNASNPCIGVILIRALQSNQGLLPNVTNKMAPPSHLSTQQRLQECLTSAVVKEDTSAIRELVLAGADPNYYDMQGYTPLHRSATSKLTLHTLLSLGAHINSQTVSSGDTALHIAAGSGNVACVRICISHGADVHIKNAMGVTPVDVVKRRSWLKRCLGSRGAAFYLQAFIAAKERDEHRQHRARNRRSLRNRNRPGQNNMGGTTEDIGSAIASSNVSPTPRLNSSHPPVQSCYHEHSNTEVPRPSHEKRMNCNTHGSGTCHKPIAVMGAGAACNNKDNDVLSTYTDEVSKLLECGICLDTVRKPVTLPCGHNFCQECIKSVMEHSTAVYRGQRFFACPLDRLQIPCSFPLRTSVTLQEITSIVEKLKTASVLPQELHL